MITNEQSIHNKEQIKQNGIEDHITKWIDIITRNIEETTPKKAYKLYPNIKESNELKLIEQTYHRLRFCTNHWTRGQIIQIRELQERIKTEMSRVVSEFWENKITNLEGIYNNPEKFWKNIRRLKGNNIQETPYLINERNEKVFELEHKLQLHRENWQSIFQIIQEENRHFDVEHEVRVNNYIRDNDERIRHFETANLERLNEADVMTRPVTTGDVKRIIKSFKDKAPGKSGITKLILVNLPEEAYLNYTTIINYALSMGYFPIIFKEGIIILILKPGKDPTKANSYRPITLLEIPGIILERILNERIQGFAEANGKFHPNQFGFRKGKGTETALMKLYETISLNQRLRGQCNVICRDIEKAFDKVWHNGLKFKILNMGLPLIIEKMTANFLDDRTAEIRLNNQLSGLINIRSGVLQGSILSPTLFILYTSDLTPAGPGCTDVLFSDDVTQIVEYHHQSKKMLVRRTEREIKRISDYEKRWKIKTSQQKFKILSISKSKPEKIEIDHTEIPFNELITVLGLKIKRTGIVQHLTDRQNGAKTELGKLRKFEKLSPKIKSPLYKTLILPILEYPAVLCCIASKENKMKMQRIQNRGIKFINKHGQAELNIEEIHQNFKIDAINVRLHTRLTKSWEKFTQIETELAERSTTENDDNETKDHYWWRRLASLVEIEQPEPVYT